VTPLTSVTALPSSGPVGGATTVTVTGTAFVASDLLYCKFGSAGRTHGTYVTSILLKCLSHSSATPGTVLLQVSNNNQDFAASLMEYLYYGMSGEVFVCLCAPDAHAVCSLPEFGSAQCRKRACAYAVHFARVATRTDLGPQAAVRG
jgi:hypothetical protein